MTIAAFFALLGVIAWTDWKTMRIPNRLNAAVFVTGLCAVFTVPGPGGEGNVLAAVLGIFAGGIWGLYLLLFKRADRRDVFPFGPCLCGGMLAAFVILCTRGSYHIL